MCKQCYGITESYNRCEIKHWTKYSNGRYYCRHHLDDPSADWKREKYNNNQQKIKDAERSYILHKNNQEQRRKRKEDDDKKIKMRNEIELELRSVIELELRNKIILELRNSDKLNELSDNLSKNCRI
jgi:hypothetical protein